MTDANSGYDNRPSGYDDRTNVSGVERDTTLSTADVANATAAAATREDEAVADRAAETRLAPEQETAPPADRTPPATSRPAVEPAAAPPARNEAAGSRADASRDGDAAPLFPADQAETLRDRWTDVQASFVDEPRDAVKQADSLVADVIQKLAQSFADERSNLERQWDRGEDVNTEDLRVSLRRYRSFFDRLLSL